LINQNSQLNHYFLAEGDFANVVKKLKDYISPEHHEKLEHVILEGKKHSIRTREMDGKVLFVVKASIDDTTSSNGTARIEFEEAANELALQELDQILLDHGFPYQSKWSRQRQEFQYKDMHVCIDKNAGYGYVAEFEKIISNPDEVDQAKQSIRDEMAALGVEELDHARLERMFAHYNQHRPEYYGTDNTFVLE
jgi:predicted adenylyl cyclase CyaB